jgi:glycosyltransferase involved in cell wall biosynthesis
VSVIIPAHNAAGMVGEAVRSALAQSEPRVEAIVVNDGSTDHTEEDLREFGADPRFRLIRQAQAGPSRARNRGMEQARGSWFVFLDADDILSPGMAAAALRAAAAYPKFAVVYGDKPLFRRGLADAFLLRAEPAESGNLLPNLVRGITITPGQFAVRRSAFESVGAFVPEADGSEDWEFLLRLADRYPFLYVPQPFVFKRVHPAMSSLALRRPDIIAERRRLLRIAFGERAAELERRYWTRPVLANWYATHGFSYGERGSMARAVYYIARSLLIWPFWRDPYRWLLRPSVRGPSPRRRMSHETQARG